MIKTSTVILNSYFSTSALHVYVNYSTVTPSYPNSMITCQCIVLIQNIIFLGSQVQIIKVQLGILLEVNEE